MTKELMCPYRDCQVYQYWTGLGDSGILIAQDDNHYWCKGITKARTTDSVVLMATSPPIVRGLAKSINSECSHIELLNLLKGKQ